jgi:hypothetical protein
MTTPLTRSAAVRVSIDTGYPRPSAMSEDELVRGYGGLGPSADRPASEPGLPVAGSDLQDGQPRPRVHGTAVEDPDIEC